MANNKILITLDTVVKRNTESFLISELGDEMVMMNMDSGDYLGINSVGTDIWNLLSEPMPVSNLVEEILSLYDVNKEQCIAEVDIFLNKMLEQDILTANSR